MYKRQAHRDIDVDFDAQHMDLLLNLLAEYGYEVDTDWRPVRIELYSEKYGYLDIHPFVLNGDGTSKQADLEGGWYEFDLSCFGNAIFEGKTIPCISVKGQKLFHSGYELRDPISSRRSMRMLLHWKRQKKLKESNRSRQEIIIFRCV